MAEGQRGPDAEIGSLMANVGVGAAADHPS